MQKNNINIVGHISACWTNELKKKSRKTKAVQTDRFKLGRLINRFFPFSTYVEKSGCNSHEQSHLWRLKKELYKYYNKSSLPSRQCLPFLDKIVQKVSLRHSKAQIQHVLLKIHRQCENIDCRLWSVPSNDVYAGFWCGASLSQDF